jgi:hypothetical protein
MMQKDITDGSIDEILSYYQILIFESLISNKKEVS